MCVYAYSVMWLTYEYVRLYNILTHTWVKVCCELFRFAMEWFISYSMEKA